MAEEKKSQNIKNKELTSSGTRKFSLIDMLMIIMLVGVILTIIIPIRQTRRHERIVKSSLADMARIIDANEEFKLNVWGEYAMDISQLNIRDLDESNFKFTVNDTAVVAVSNTLAAEEKAFYYDLRDKRFRVRQDSRDIIFDAWLP